MRPSIDVETLRVALEEVQHMLVDVISIRTGRPGVKRRLSFSARQTVPASTDGRGVITLSLERLRTMLDKSDGLLRFETVAQLCAVLLHETVHNSSCRRHDIRFYRLFHDAVVSDDSPVATAALAVMSKFSHLEGCKTTRWAYKVTGMPLSPEETLVQRMARQVLEEPKWKFDEHEEVLVEAVMTPDQMVDFADALHGELDAPAGGLTGIGSLGFGHVADRIGAWMP